MKKKRNLGLILIILAVPVIYFMFFMNSSDASKQLKGNWVRSDGVYTIAINEVQANGKLDVAYFNPNPIHIGSSGWKIEDGILKVFVELQDKNYPGSIYQLNYNEKTDELSGTYYQAVARETYEIYFNRKIE